MVCKLEIRSFSMSETKDSSPIVVSAIPLDHNALFMGRASEQAMIINAHFLKGKPQESKLMHNFIKRVASLQELH